MPNLAQKLHYSILSFWISCKGERINFISHLIGLIFSIIGIILLLISTKKYFYLERLSILIYGFSLFIMYLSSTIYHATYHPKKKKFLQIIDHCSIYILIAGTYTPFTFITLKNNNGYFLLGLVWIIAILGIIFKIIWKDKYDLFATLGYLIAGWVILIDIKKFYEIFPKDGFNWIFMGGLLYTIGALFYLIEKLPRNHEIWHGFVLLASYCHFQAVYSYL